MERLTERTADGILVKENYEKESLKTLYSCYGEKPNSYYSNCEEGYCAMEKLADYEDAEEQGLLLRLPCKMGDKVYQISENFIEPCTVETIFLGNYRDRNGNWCNMAEIHYDRDDCPYVSTEIYFTDIGETVFLTETEAEAKLKEMEGESDVL